MEDRECFRRIRKNIVEYYCDSESAPDELICTMDKNGSYRDLDYATQNWTMWGPYLHAARLAKLSGIYAAESGKYYHGTKIADTIHCGLKFLLESSFRSDNWWMNDVGLPVQCGLIRLLFGNELNLTESAELLRISKGNPDKPMEFTFPDVPKAGALRPYNGCGLHLISEIKQTLVQIAVENGDSTEAMSRIRDCIRAVDIELQTANYAAGRSPMRDYADEHCIKSDYSYHEHENTMLQNTYGKSMIENLADVFLFIRNSGIHLSEGAKRELTNLLLDGYALLRYREAAPMMTLGRDVGSADKKSYHCDEYSDAIKVICNWLLENDGSYRKEEIEAWLNMTSNPEGTPNFTRTKYFWHSDLLSHNRPGYQFTVHGVSKRLKRPESILKKNILGMYLGDGTYNLMQTGYEYEGAPPYLDWFKLPGTTSNQGAENLNPECEIDTELDKLRLFGGAHGTTGFVGGVSDDEYGFFAMDYKHLNVSAKKAWFCFDEGVVCLGADICGNGDGGVFTTLDQRNSIGDVEVDGEKPGDGEYTLSNCRYVLSDGVGYIFLQPSQQVYLANEIRTGAWSRVDKDSGTDEPVSGRIFLLGINHGLHPNHASYAYQLLPGVNEESIYKFLNKPLVNIVENSGGCQAVWHSKSRQLQAVFYKKGSVSNENITVTVSQPCALLLRLCGDGFRLWVSNPEHEAAEIIVTLSGDIEKELCFNLREGILFNDLGRPLGYDSEKGFLPYCGAQGEEPIIKQIV